VKHPFLIFSYHSIESLQTVCDKDRICSINSCVVFKLDDINIVVIIHLNKWHKERSCFNRSVRVVVSRQRSRFFLDYRGGAHRSLAHHYGVCGAVSKALVLI
jgi:hypothetical protein